MGWSTLFPRAQSALWSFKVSMWASAVAWGAPAVMLIKPVQNFLLQNIPSCLGSSNLLNNNEVRMVGFGRLASVMSVLSVGAAVALTAYNQRLANMRCNESTATARLAVKSMYSEPE